MKFARLMPATFTLEHRTLIRPPRPTRPTSPTRPTRLPPVAFTNVQQPVAARVAISRPRTTPLADRQPTAPGFPPSAGLPPSSVQSRAGLDHGGQHEFAVNRVLQRPVHQAAVVPRQVRVLQQRAQALPLPTRQRRHPPPTLPMFLPSIFLPNCSVSCATPPHANSGSHQTHTGHSGPCLPFARQKRQRRRSRRCGVDCEVRAPDACDFHARTPHLDPSSASHPSHKSHASYPPPTRRFHQRSTTGRGAGCHFPPANNSAR